MQFTSNEEYDIDKRVQLTNEIPPYCAYDGLNHVLQNSYWKWFLGSSTVEYSCTKTGVISAMDEPIKIVNGTISENYGPKFEKVWNTETLDYDTVAPTYHRMEIDGILLPETDLFLHEIYRYMSFLYPDHPDYRFLLTENEFIDAFTSAGKITNVPFNTDVLDLITQDRTDFDEDYVAEEKAKMLIRHLLDFPTSRKFASSWYGYRMEGGDIFESISVFPVGSYLPLLPISKTDVALDDSIDTSFWENQQVDVQSRLLNHKVRLIDWEGDDITPYQKEAQSATFTFWTIPGFDKSIFEYPLTLPSLSDIESIDTSYNLSSPTNEIDTFISKTYSSTLEKLTTFEYDSSSDKVEPTEVFGTNAVNRLGLGQQVDIHYIKGTIFTDTEDLLDKASFKDIQTASLGYGSVTDYENADYANALAGLYRYCSLSNIDFTNSFSFTFHPYHKGTLVLPPTSMLEFYADDVDITTSYDTEGNYTGFKATPKEQIPTDENFPVVGKHLSFVTNYESNLESYVYPTIYEVTGLTCGTVDITCSSLPEKLLSIVDPTEYGSRLALVAKGTNGYVVFYGSMEMVFEYDETLHMQPSTAKFHIEAVPETKDDSFLALIYGDSYEDDYSSTEIAEFKKNRELLVANANTTSETLTIFDNSEVFFALRYPTVDKTSFVYSKVDSYSTGIVTSFDFGGITILPLESNGNLATIPETIGKSSDLVDIKTYTSEDLSLVYPRFKAFSRANINSYNSGYIESDELENVVNLYGDITATQKETNNILIEASTEANSNTIQFKTEDAIYKMNTLCVGDTVTGYGLPSDTYITAIGYHSVDLSNEAFMTGSFILNFEVAYLSVAQDIDKNTYYIKNNTDKGSFIKKTPFETGFYESSNFPNTSLGIVDGALISASAISQMVNEPTFLTLVQLLHASEYKDVVLGNSYCLPSILSTKSDVFVEVNLNHLLHKEKLGQDCLMFHEYLDYLQSELSYINRKSDRVSVGTNLLLETDRTGFFSSLPDSSYTDPNTKIKFITRSWTEDTIPFYAQVGTNGAGRSSWFKSSQDVSYPDLWGGGYYDAINKEMVADLADLEASGGFLQKRNFWRDKDSYLSTSSDLEDNLSDYISVEEPLFEIPLGEYDIIKDYSGNKRATTLVQCSFIKQNVSGSLTDETVSLTSSDFLNADIFYEIGTFEAGNALIKNFAADNFVKPICKGFVSLDMENADFVKPTLSDSEKNTDNFYYWITNNSVTYNSNLFNRGAVVSYYKGAWNIRNLQNLGVYGSVTQGSAVLALSDYSFAVSDTKTGTLSEALKFKMAAASSTVSATEITSCKTLNGDRYIVDGNTLWNTAYSRQSEHLDNTMIPYVICLESPNTSAFEQNAEYEKYLSSFCTVSDCYAVGLVELEDGKESLLFIDINKELVASQTLPVSNFISSNESSFLTGGTVLGKTFDKCGINLLLQNETTYTLPNGYITPSTIEFNMLVKCPVMANVISESDYTSGNTDVTELMDISYSAIYKDKVLDAFFVEKDGTQYYIKFNENKFFKNVVFIMGNYYTLTTVDSSGETTSNILLEKIDGIPFDTTSLLTDDTVLAFEEIYLRSTPADNITMYSFCDNTSLNSRMYGIDETGNLVLVNPKNIWNSEDSTNFSSQLTQWLPLNVRQDSLEFPFTQNDVEYKEPTILNAAIAKPTILESTSTPMDFKFFKNLLVISGVVSSTSASFVRLQNTEALQYLASGDSITNIEYLSPLSSTFTNISFIDDSGNPLIFQKIFYADNTLIGVTASSQIWYNKTVADLTSSGAVIAFAQSMGFSVSSEAGEDFSNLHISYNNVTEEFYICGNKDSLSKTTAFACSKDLLNSQFNELANGVFGDIGVNLNDTYVCGSYTFDEDGNLVTEESYPYIKGQELSYAIASTDSYISENSHTIAFSEDNNVTFDVGGVDNAFDKIIGADNFTLMIMGDICFAKSPVYKYSEITTTDEGTTVAGDSILSSEQYWKYTKIPSLVSGDSEVAELTIAKAYANVVSLRDYYAEVVNGLVQAASDETDEITYSNDDSSVATSFEFRSKDVLQALKTALGSLLTFANFTARASNGVVTVTGFTLVDDFVPDYTVKYRYAYVGSAKTNTYTGDMLTDGSYNYEHAYKQYLSDFVSYICMNTTENSFSSNGIKEIKVIGDKAYVILTSGGFVCLDKSATYTVDDLANYSNWKRPTFPENTYYAGLKTTDSSWFVATDTNWTNVTTGETSTDKVSMKIPQRVCGAICRTFETNFVREIGNNVIVTGYYKSKSEVSADLTNAGLSTAELANFTDLLNTLSDTRKACVLVANKDELNFTSLTISSLATQAGCPIYMNGFVHIPLVGTSTELLLTLDDDNNVNTESVSIKDADSTYTNAFEAESYTVGKEILFADENKPTSVVLSEYSDVSLTSSKVAYLSDTGIYLPENLFNLDSSDSVSVQVLMSIKINASVQNPLMFVDTSNTSFYSNGYFRVPLVEEVKSYLDADSMYSYRETTNASDTTGYPAVFEDTEKQYYSYDSDDNLIYFENANGARLLLVDSTGESVILQRRELGVVPLMTRYNSLTSAGAFDSLPRAGKVSNLDAISESHGITEPYADLLTTINPQTIKSIHTKLPCVKVSTGLESPIALVDLLVPYTDETKANLIETFQNLYSVNLQAIMTVINSSGEEEEMSTFDYFFESKDIGENPYLYNKYLGCFVVNEQLGFYGDLDFGFRNTATVVNTNYLFSREETAHKLIDLNGKNIYGIYIPAQGYGGHRYHTDNWLMDSPSEVDPDLFTEYDAINERGDRVFLVDSTGTKIKGREGVEIVTDNQIVPLPVATLNKGEAHNLQLLQKNNDGTDTVVDTLVTKRYADNGLHIVLSSDVGYLENSPDLGIQDIVAASVYYGLKDVTAECELSYTVANAESEGITIEDGFLRANASFLDDSAKKTVVIEAIYKEIKTTSSIDIEWYDGTGIQRQSILPLMFFDKNGNLIKGASFELNATDMGVTISNGSFINGVLYPSTDFETEVTFEVNSIAYKVTKLVVPEIELLTNTSSPVIGKTFKVFAVSGDTLIEGYWNGAETASSIVETSEVTSDVTVSFVFGETTIEKTFVAKETSDFLEIDNPLVNEFRNVTIHSSRELYLKGVKGTLYLKFPKYDSLSDVTSSGLGFAIPYTTRIDVSDVSLDTIETGVISLSSEITNLSSSVSNHILRLKILPKTPVDLDTKYMNNPDYFTEIPLSEKDNYGYERICWNPSGLPESPVIIDDKFFNYENVDKFDMTTSLKNNLNGLVHLCDDNGYYIGYRLNANEEKESYVLGTNGDLTSNVTQSKDDRRSIWNPSYQSCKEWYEDSFYLADTEKNPFWQKINLREVWDEQQKTMVETITVKEFQKQGGKMVELETDSPYIEASKSVIPYKYSSDYHFDKWISYTNKADGTVTLTTRVSDSFLKEESLLKYGISVVNKLYNNEDTKTYSKIPLEIDYAYEFNSLPSCLKKNDTVSITELGLFDQSHNIIAYATFPPIEVSINKGQHLSFTCSISKDVLSPKE